jgi:hypothetical protein
MEHIAAAPQIREEKLCRYVNEQERVVVGRERNLAALREENRVSMESCKKRRQTKVDDVSEFDSEVEMEDAAPLPPPRRH